MIPQGSSFQNSTSSGVGGGDWFAGETQIGPQFGPIYGASSGGGSGFSVSTPVLIAAAVVIGLVVWGRK